VMLWLQALAQLQNQGFINAGHQAVVVMERTPGAGDLAVELVIAQS
jgi:hypothetical protein